ncbi:MAG: hypothetical protein LBT48_05260 [Prevotellaceae bacterium]|jgi:hypothetical protein|nr:hypothetical protein [Prevotellaceae bacterium]
MTQFFKFWKQYANYSGRTMETGDHFKNGASPKSLMSRGNFNLFAIFVLLVSVFAFSSCGESEEYLVPLTTPTNLKTTQVDNGIKISWDKSDGSEVYYDIVKSSDKSDLENLDYGDYYRHVNGLYFSYYIYELYYIDENPDSGNNYYRV